LTDFKKNKLVTHSKYVLFACLLSLVGHSVLAQSKDVVRFAHISDTHISFLEKFHPVIQKKRAHYGNGAAALENFLTTFPQKTGVDFITITGDLIDFYQGVSPEFKLIDNQIQQFTPILEKSQVPVYMSLGNHDIATNIVDDDDYDGTPLNAHTARAAWTRSVDCFKKGTHYSRIIQVGATTYRLIFLDNGYYAKTKPDEPEDFYFENEQFDWLDWQLNQSQDDVEIVLMHIPFRPGQKRGTGSQKLFDLLLGHKSMQLILAGHEHINEILPFQSDKHEKFTQVLTGAFGRNPNTWRLVELTESGVRISKPGSEENEITIQNVPR
jgi:3',5'-cyclic AMP phosphodiesterase CpdA